MLQQLGCLFRDALDRALDTSDVGSDLVRKLFDRVFFCGAVPETREHALRLQSLEVSDYVG